MKVLIAVLGLLPLLRAQEPAKPAAEPAKPAAQEEAKPAEAKKDDKAAADKAAPSGDAAFSGSIDVGYRFRSDVAGNFAAYRTTVNLGEGPKLFGFDLRLQSPTHKYFDKVSLFGLGWGGDPYSTARLDAMKEHVYDLHIDYKNISYFNFLPTFANPFLGSGVLTTDRGYDLRHRQFDSELRLRPGTRIIPYIAYAQDGSSGGGVTTFVEGGNEYPVFSSLHDSTKRVRGGVNFEFSRWHATIEEGGAWYKNDDTDSNNQRALGDVRTPFAGQQLSLNNVTESYRVRGDSSFTRAMATFTPFSWLDVSGQFLYSKPNVDVKYASTAAGNFVNLATLQFFGSQVDASTASADQPHSSGSVYAEIRPISRVRILESYMTDRLHVTSAVLLSQITNLTPAALAQNGADNFIANYSRHQTEVLVDITRWLTVRGGFRYVWGDLEVRQPQVNGTGFDNVEMKQNVVLAGAQMRFGQKTRVSLDAEGGSADKTYFRTSLHDYQKGTARVRYQAFTTLGFNSSLSVLNNENPTPGVNYDFKNRQASLGFFWNPANSKRMSLLGDYTFSSVKSNIGYFLPPFFTSDISAYRDNSHTGTLLFDCVSPKGKFAPHASFGGSFFKSSGSRPTTYVQPLAKLWLPVQEHANVFAEWRYYGLGEQYYAFEGFRSHVFQIGLRLLK